MTTPSHQHSAVGDAFAVVRSALRLMWRHWPVLLALALFAFAARRGMIVAAAKISDLHAVAALFVYAFVPLTMLIPMLLMMRVARRSLPESTAIKLSDNRSATLLHIASVLVPFLAVYASYEFFDEDKRAFVYEVLQEEVFRNADIFNNPDNVNVKDRLPSEFNLTMATVIGAVIGLRLLLGFFARKRQPGLILGFSRGYLEATWISLTAISLNGFSNPAVEWFLDRRLVTWFFDTRDATVAAFGPLSGPVGKVVDWFGQIVLTADTVIIIPFAWLTIGCVIYGSELISPPRSLREAQALKRWERLNPVVRRMLLPVRNAADDRFGPMLRGVRLLSHAGLRTMLLFCLAFVVAQALPEWLWELERLLIGPQNVEAFWDPLSGPMSAVNEAIGLMFTLCLVTAAVDYVLRVPPPPAEPTGAEPPPPSPGDGKPDVSRIGEPSVQLHGDRAGVGGGEENNRGSVFA